MKYSFLVCAYNAEKYLEECLNSLVNQTINKKDYEIVLVNDGSTDKTVEIAKKFKSVKIVSQENMGLPEARNTAIDNSKGDWLLYVDSDDYVSENYLEEVDNIVVSKPEVNFIKIWEKKEGKASKADEKVQSNKIDDSVVSRAIRRDVFNDYRFPGEFKFAIEDWDFYVHNFHKFVSEDISTNKDIFYFYRYTEGSLSKTNNIYLSRFEHALWIFEDTRTRDLNLKQGIIGHYWEHLYMVARLWHPELMQRVKSTKYKVRIRPAIKLQYLIVKLGIFNYFIRKTGKSVKK